MLSTHSRTLLVLEHELEGINIKLTHLDGLYNRFLVESQPQEAEEKAENTTFEVDEEQFVESATVVEAAEQTATDKSAEAADDADLWGDAAPADTDAATPAVVVDPMAEKIRQQKIQQFEDDLVKLKEQRRQKEFEINKVKEAEARSQRIISILGAATNLVDRMQYAFNLVQKHFAYLDSFKESKSDQAVFDPAAPVQKFDPLHPDVLSTESFSKILSLIKSGFEMDEYEYPHLKINPVAHAWQLSEWGGKILLMLPGRRLERTLVEQTPLLFAMYERMRQKIERSEAFRASYMAKAKQAEIEFKEIAAALAKPAHQLSTEQLGQFENSARALNSARAVGIVVYRSHLLTHLRGMYEDLLQCPQILEILLRTACDIACCFKEEEFGQAHIDAQPFIKMFLILVPLLKDEVQQGIALNRLVVLAKENVPSVCAQINELHAKIRLKPVASWGTPAGLDSIVFFGRRPVKDHDVDQDTREMTEKLKASALGLGEVSFKVNEKSVVHYFECLTDFEKQFEVSSTSKNTSYEYCAVLHESLKRITGQTGELIELLTGIAVKSAVETQVNLQISNREEAPVVSFMCDIAALVENFRKQLPDAVTTDAKGAPVNPEQRAAFELYHYITRREQDGNHPVRFEMYGDKLLINMCLTDF